MIKVLLVDDEASVRQGLRMRMALEPDLAVVGEAGDGVAAVKSVQDLDPDVVVTDVEDVEAGCLGEHLIQVVLAQLKSSRPRLTEMDAGLSRLTGGIGGRGPVETVMEMGRRRIRDRIGRTVRTQVRFIPVSPRPRITWRIYIYTPHPTTTSRAITAA